MTLLEIGDKQVHRPPVLGIDIGSSSVRVGVFDASLRPVEGSLREREYAIETGPDGRAVLDPEMLFSCVADGIDSAVSIETPIDAVGISGFWHSLVGVDSEGKPTTNVLTWADTRAAVVVPRIRRQLDDERHHQRTGTRIHSSYPLAKIRWLHDEYPDIWERTERWMSFAEYLQYRLFGRATVSTSMASGTGLLDRATLDWAPEACASARVEPHMLSEIDDRPIHGLRDEYATRWPSLADAAWFPAIGDGAANNLGSGALDGSRPALMVGTTGATRIMSTDPPDTLPSGLWQYRLDREHVLIGGALSEGGGVLNWLFRGFNLPDDSELHEHVSKMRPDSHGLTVLPYLAGERSPDWRSDAVGTFHGLRFDTKPVEIVRATMESIAFSFASILDEMDPMLERSVEIIATGNGLRKNRVWVQIIADALGYPVLLPHQTEASLRGATLYALRHLGVETEPPDLTRDADRFEHDRERWQIYRSARVRRDRLKQLLTNW